VDDEAGKAIVIMDDETSFSDFLGDLLGEHFRCSIVSFTDPLALVDALPQLNVGVLVTDYYMPNLNGLELIRRAAEVMPVAPPCILITAHTFEDEEEICRPPHFKAILAKPFRWQQLASLIVKHWPPGADSPLRDPLHPKF
jgi:CheY-like chemotaxis protein